ncbi:MAG: hypothetical protein PHP01_05970, partial [Phycisphaerae bacterium]|nr:hypothetical protein [Phycisphaerae bacterium]
MEKRIKTVVVIFAITAAILSATNGAVITQTYILDEPSSTSPVQNLNGLSAKAIFTYDTALPNILRIELFNTSVGVPAGFSNADQLLTGISFDFGHP